MTDTVMLKEIAYHESAHAVVATHFDFWVSQIDIVEDEKFEGRSIISVPRYDHGDHVEEYITTIFNDAVVDFAGAAAQAKPRRKSIDYFLPECHTDTEVAAEKLLFYVLAKEKVIEPCDFDFIDCNRMTDELFDDWTLANDWKRIDGDWKLGIAMDAAQREAKNIVKQRWQSIKNVAKALQKRQILDWAGGACPR